MSHLHPTKKYLIPAYCNGKHVNVAISGEAYWKLVETLEPEKDMVCAACGQETNKEDGPCDNCESFRIVPINFVEQHFGKDWKKAFDPKEKK